MKPYFSELQYAYSCTRELEDILLSCGVPYFPSLVEEASVGFDVRVDTIVAPVFLQYKVADYLQRRNSKYWDLFNVNHYRFPIYPADKSPQHNLLKSLSVSQPFVFYCSSCFFEYSDYRLLHEDRRIMSQSTFINLRELPYNSGSYWHHIVYNPTRTTAFWCSNPVEINLYKNWEQVLYYIRNQSDDLIKHRIQDAPNREHNNDRYQDQLSLEPELGKYSLDSYIIRIHQLLINALEEQKIIYKPKVSNNNTREVLQEISGLLESYFSTTLIFLKVNH
ncbi:hypothetical protein [Paenibacillus sp. PSB04]|uniref:hypothetical protein n=1 Tax=Paenibacillus sp. PSB04 TaxID=2866810 RepID=UPI0021F1E5DB|nr:hypothetical protein [Paenibacillus sp. PSB04]UYO06440.1 hypothetical protein K2F33_11455 [Paenibacillus sp. PSB04]